MSSTGDAVDWRSALARACRGDGVRGVYQPLVNLQSGTVVGFEALVRFEGVPRATPDVWFAAAREHGREADLEAAALGATLAHRPDLPPNCFLSINIGPTTLAAPQVRDRLASEPDLKGVVLEITEHTPIESYVELAGHLDVHRNRGALVAIDDAGSGYAGLSHILELKPSMLKLDRSLISDIDRDEAKRALVEMLGLFASRIDAWVLAEGIETRGELQTLRRLGVPLGQGYLLARPSPPWVNLSHEAESVLHAELADHDSNGDEYGVDTLRAIVEPAPWLSMADRRHASKLLGDRPSDTFVVMVDDDGSPVGALTPTASSADHLDPILRVAASTAVAEAARRALTRPIEHRFDPLVCTDATGRLVGFARMERIIEFLARASMVEPMPDPVTVSD